MPRLLFMAVVSLALPARAQIHSELATAACLSADQDSTASPTPLHAREPRVDRLEEALEELGSAGAASVTWTAISNLVVGGLLVGFGAWVLVDHADAGADDSSVVAGVLAGAMGGALLASSVHAVVGRRTTDQLRVERWRTLRAKGLLDDRALARFEGELAAEAEFARWSRTATGVLYIGVGAAGAGVIALAAADQVPHGSRGLAYLEGGLLIALGLWQSIANLAGTSHTEDVVRRYLDGETSPQVSLTAHATGAQLRLSARF